MALHGVFGASLYLQPGRASPHTGRTAFREITSLRTTWDARTQRERERESRTDRKTDRKAEGQQPGYGDPSGASESQGIPRRPGWRSVSLQSSWGGLRWALDELCIGKLQPPGQVLTVSPASFLVSWKVGPWTPCSASCGGGFQSRSVYCVASDGTGGQEAAEETQCAGLAGKPPATQACNLQHCAVWSVEPWGEVRRARSCVWELGLKCLPSAEGLRERGT